MDEYKLLPLVIPHRGIIQCAPENTLEAVKACVDLGFNAAEIDIRKSRDGEIIVVHDADLTRLTLGHPAGAVTGVISEMSWAELSEVEIPCENLPRTAKLLRFRDLARWVRESAPRDFLLEVEFKASGMVGLADEIVRSEGIAGNCIFFSGEKAYIDEIQSYYKTHAKPDGLKLGANIRFLTPENKLYIEDKDLYEVGLNAWAFTSGDAEYLLERGVKVFSNLGDTPDWWRKLKKLPVAGFKTNFAQQARECLKGTENSSVRLPVTLTAHAGFDGTEYSTKESILHAAALGVDVIEIDVCKDLKYGDYYVSHDEASDYRAEGLMPLGTVFSLITGANPGVQIQADCKEQDSALEIIQIAKENGVGKDRLIVAGGNTYGYVLRNLKEIKEGAQLYMNPDAISSYEEMLLSTDEFIGKVKAVDAIVNTSFEAFNTAREKYGFDLLEKFLNAGIKISAWTFNSEGDIMRYMTAGLYNMTSRLKEIILIRENFLRRRFL